MKNIQLALLALAVMVTVWSATEAGHVHSYDRLCSNKCIDQRESCIDNCNVRDISASDSCYTACDKKQAACSKLCSQHP
ncbi:hypothetical protein LSAT2_003281 [Lamellibrachia satsuma]|nr:hypothetical protein LSAT2_003281 [Lamellibrachia satsuma]